jgi:hypothetical protein
MDAWQRVLAEAHKERQCHVLDYQRKFLCSACQGMKAANIDLPRIGPSSIVIRQLPKKGF